MEISKLGVHFIIISLFYPLFYPLFTIKPFALPWAPHEVFNFFDLVNKIPQCHVLLIIGPRGNPTKLGMSACILRIFLLSQLASLQSFCCSAESPL